MKILRTTLVILLLVNAVLAHGGEDHSHEALEAPAPEAGQTVLKLGRTSRVEVLVKYQEPSAGEEAQLKIFVTDIDSNAPVEGLEIALEFAEVLAARSSDSGVSTTDSLRLSANAQPTETAGIYLAVVKFPVAGQYNLTLKLKGERVSAQLLMTGLTVVETKASAQPRLATGITAGVLVLAGLAVIALSKLRKAALRV